MIVTIHLQHTLIRLNVLSISLEHHKWVQLQQALIMLKVCMYASSVNNHKWVNCNNTLATHIDDTQSMHYALSLEYHKIVLIATHIDDAQVHALMHPPLNIIVNGWILDLGREGKQAEPVAVLAFVL